MSRTDLPRAALLKRRRRHHHHRTSILVLILAVIVLGTAGTAVAFWAASATGNAAALAGSLSAPTSPTATANSSSQITVGWNNPGTQLAGAQYQVVRTSGPGSPFTVCTVASTVSSCPDTGLSAGLTYGYSIIAFLDNWHTTAITASTATTSTGPTVTSLSPSALDDGATAAVVTVTGTGFVSGGSLASTVTGHAGVTVNSTTFVNATTLTLSVTVTGSATQASDYQYNLTNGNGATTNLANALTIAGAPTVTSLSPSTLDRGATNAAVTVLGTNFVNDTHLATTFSGTNVTVNSTTFVNATTLTLSVTVAVGASTGVRNINLTNGDGSTATLANALTIAVVPTIASLSPLTLDRGATNATVTVTGTGFVSGAQLATTFSGTGVTAGSAAFVNPTTLTLTVTVTSVAATGARTMNLTNGDGSTATKTSALTIAAAPIVTSLSPSALGQGATNLAVTVTGTGFINGTPLASTITGHPGVTVNSTTFVSATTLTLSVTVSGSATLASDYQFDLTNGDGSTATKTNAATVETGPTVSSITSLTADGKPAQGDTITITFNKAINPSTICSSWVAGTAETTGNNTNTTVTLTKNASGNNTMTVSDTTDCSGDLKIFSGDVLDLGTTGYVTTAGTPPTTAVFTTDGHCNGGHQCSEVSINAADTVLTITLGALSSGTVGTVASNPGVTYTPSSAILGVDGAVVTSSATDSATKFF